MQTFRQNIYQISQQSFRERIHQKNQQKSQQKQQPAHQRTQQRISQITKQSVRQEIVFRTRKTHFNNCSQVVVYSMICIIVFGQLLFPGMEVFAHQCSSQDITSQHTLPQRDLLQNDLVQEGDMTELTNLNASSAILMDADNGRVLFDKAANEPRANASTTKIMTCILALEMGQQEDIVSVSSLAAKQPDVQMNICEGEQYYLEDLLYGLMLESYNDVAVAIAEYIAGSVEAFADMMNEKAEEIGAYDTHFVTPNGLDADEHYTTAYDLALIAKYAIQNPDFLEICKTPSKCIAEVNGKRVVTAINHDAFLTSYEGAIGIKTGFTGNAGYCFVGAAQRGEKTLISVVLACGWPPHKTYKWSDTKALMDYGMNNYEKRQIIDLNYELPSIPVTEGIESSELNLQLDIQSDLNVNEAILLREDEIIHYELEVPEYIEAPVQQGEPIGIMNIYIDDSLYKAVVLKADSSITRIDYRYLFIKVLERFALIDNVG